MKKPVSKPLYQINFHLTEGFNPACRVCSSHQLFACKQVKNGKNQTLPAYFPLVKYASLSSYQPSASSQPGPSLLEKSVVEQALLEALPLGLQAVKLTGREPYLHPDFDAILDLLVNHQLKVTIETSGKGLTEGRAQHLARLISSSPGGQAWSVVIGLYGADASTHDWISESSGSFDTAIRAAQNLLKAGVKPHLVFTIVRQNVWQITEMICLAEKLGAACASFILVQPTREVHAQPGNMITVPSTGKLISSEPLKVEELIALGRRIEREIAPHTPLRLYYDQPPAFRGLNPQSTADTPARCGALNSVNILPGGEITLCGSGDLVSELILGQIGPDPLDKLWNEHPVLAYLREGLPQLLQGVCQRCLFKSTCLGHCIAQNYYRTGSFWSPYWFCESAERAGLFPASRLAENSFR